MTEKPDLFLFDQQVREEGFLTVCGVDEAGRGPLAGPVVAACAVLGSDFNVIGVDDSKKLSEKKREALFEPIKQYALAYGIGEASAQEIDEHNILQATFLAMGRAVENLKENFKLQPDILLVDGNRDPKIMDNTRTVIKGDANSASIAAASILAKVTRDRELVKLDEIYPQYAFKQHKGYPTKLHYERISEYGISPVHRRSFLKKILNG